MKLIVDVEIIEKYPEVRLGVVKASNLENRESDDRIMGLIRQCQSEIREKYSLETLAQHPRIRAWREAYSQFGARPKKYRSSVESLYRMTLKDIDLRSINGIVDIYNYISLKYMIPAGGDDLDKVEGDIRLGLARGVEPFTPLNSKMVETAKPGEVVYRDDNDILCRRWNWRECDKTKMTEVTRNVLLVVEGLPPFTREHVRNITGELQELVQKFCGGEGQNWILDTTRREIKL